MKLKSANADLEQEDFLLICSNDNVMRMKDEINESQPLLTG